LCTIARPRRGSASGGKNGEVTKSFDARPLAREAVPAPPTGVEGRQYPENHECRLPIERQP
jgi:hypothetical protein